MGAAITDQQPLRTLLMKGLISWALLFGSVTSALGACPSPNPNISAGVPGNPFIDGCPLPASGLNNLAATIATKGNVFAPTTATAIGEVALFNNLTGTLLKDAGPGLTLSIPAASLGRGLQVFQASGGTVGGGVSYYLNQISNNPDTMAVPGPNFGVNLNIQDNFGGSGAAGGRIGANVGVLLTSSTSVSNTNHNYVGISGNAEAAAGDNGTGGSPQGAFFTYGGYALADSGATNLLELSGAEINIAAKTGSSVYGKFGWTLVELGTDAVHGTIEAALGVSSIAGAVGWNVGILFSNFNGQYPIATGGDLVASSGGTVVRNALNLAGTIVSNCFLNTSMGCLINGAGTLLTSGNYTSIGTNIPLFFYSDSGTHVAGAMVAVGNTVNYASLVSGTTGVAPQIHAAGSDTNVDIIISGQGSGGTIVSSMPSSCAGRSAGTLVSASGHGGTVTWC
jgi:hypothetical protein